MKTCLIAALSLALMACAGSSPRIDTARLGELQKGQTTVDEVVRKFGRPSILSKNPDGTQTAIYMHSEGPSTTTTMVPLITTMPADSNTFYFDTKGLLTDYKTKQANASKSAPDSADKPAQASADKTTAAGSGKTALGNNDKTTQGNTGGWSFLVPSATKENR